MDFRVQLDDFSGPLDLLLYLVRKHEVDAVDVPVAMVTDQFLHYVDVLEQMEIDSVADYLDLASALIEIKSRMVLPRTEEIEEPEIEDPREELVARLLEFKSFRDAARLLEQRGREWQSRFARRVPAESGANAGEPRRIEGVEIWDLVSAFGRVMRHKLADPIVDTIRYDDTPLHVFVEQIDEVLRQRQRIEFFELFPDTVHKSTLVGMFLAVLELIRNGRAAAEQQDRYGTIWLAAADVSHDSRYAASTNSEAAS